MSPSMNNKGVTLVELMIAMAIGALLVLMAMVLYVPVSRSLLDQAAVSQQSLAESLNYDFDVMNVANAGYGVLNAAVNTNVVLVTGNGPGNNAQVVIPTTTGSVQGTGLFWSWADPAGATTLACAGLQVVPGTVAGSGNDRLVYFEEVAQNGSCTGAFWNTPGNWDTVTVTPSIAVSTAPVTVATGQNCDLRGSQIANYPVLHPAATFLLPVAATLTGGFFAHKADLVPVSVCLRNLP